MSATLYTGTDDLEVVGESFHQDELWAIVGAARGNTPGDVRLQEHAILVPESGNPYDANAVGVWISGMKIGHLSRDDAAALRPGIIRAVRDTGCAVVLQAVIVGGGQLDSGRVKHLGVWMSYDRTDFGLAPIILAAPPATATLRTGLSAALALDEADDDFDLGWLDRLPDNPSKRLAALRAMLDQEAEPLSRHFMLSELEAELYAFRDTFPTALDEYDRAAEQHDREMDAIRPVLLEKFGSLPMLETYKQSTIRHGKAKDLDRALWWARRGIEVYGDDAHKDEWVADLHKRIATIEARMTRTSSPRSNVARADLTEELVCQSCGVTFTRTITRGRKPHNCPACRGR